MKFTMDSYIELLEVIKSRDYKIIFFNQIGTFNKEVIIRHDVDFSLEKALEMAILENKLSVSSTFFILLSSPFYNVHEKESLKTLKNIMSLGHSIGLHFDHTVYDTENLKLLEEKAYEEITMLSSILNINIETISFHRPAKFLLDSSFSISKDILNTYSKPFFSEIKYISD